MVDRIYVYVEGGGDGANTKAQLREGFTVFLREIKDAIGGKLRVVACGGRSATYEAFRIAMASNPDSFNVLLVDAEGPVDSDPLRYVSELERVWEMQEVNEEQCHLMVQMMEAWLIADIVALSAFYGQGFLRSSIPKSNNVESVEKNRLKASLANSTKHTQKGEYHKIKHGASLLSKVDPATVRSKARHCRRLFITLAEQVGDGGLLESYKRE